MVLGDAEQWFLLKMVPVSNTSGHIVNLELIFRGEHAEEVPDQESLLDNFIALGRLEQLDRGFSAELRLDYVVDGVHIDAVVAFLDAANIQHTGQVVNLLTSQAEHTSLVKFKEAFLFVDYHAFYLAAVDEDQAEEQNDDGHCVLPPVSAKKTALSQMTKRKSNTYPSL